MTAPRPLLPSIAAQPTVRDLHVSVTRVSSDPKEGPVRLPRLAIIALPLVLGGLLTSCTKSTDQATPGTGGCKIALLLPENATPRYEAADKPYFEAEVAKQASECQVLYFNAANDG